VPDLILVPSSTNQHIYLLRLREAGPAETEYHTIASVSLAVAKDIIRAGAAFWLHGEPDDPKPKPAIVKPKKKELQSCSSCKFCSKVSSPVQLFCQRFPPTRKGFIETHAVSWCGEYVAMP
jgi:hypothetical protein